jgi:purine-binding chemotaxis protein CheW
MHSDSRSDEILQIVSFHVGSEEFGLDILKVQEIIRFQQLTRVPNMPSYVEGVLNLRGKVIPVVGLRQRIGLERQAPTPTTKIVVASVKSEVLGFVVDSVSEVLRINRSSVEPTPRLSQVSQKYVAGVGKLDNRLLLLLDLDQALSAEESSAVAEVTNVGAAKAAAAM